MKFNVKPNDCRFVVNKDKRTVVCIYENSSQDFIKFIDNNCKLSSHSIIWSDAGMRLHDKMFMPNRFVGVAICGPNDEWDESTGRLIAFSRMKDKLNRSFFKRANTFINTIDSWINDTVDILNTIGEKLEINQDKRHKRIEELVREKNKEDV